MGLVKKLGRTKPLIHPKDHCHSRIHVRGYKEKGNINAPLALAINHQIDRFNLVIDVINWVPKLDLVAAYI